MKSSKKVLVIIPAYNEALNIEKTVEDIKKNAKDVDYVVVNDGSRDNTLEILKKNKYNYIDLIQNLGLFGAVQTGLKYAVEKGYDVAIQFDGDGQHQAKYIKTLVDEIGENNIVIGSRFVTKKKPFTMRMLGSRLIGFSILLAAGIRIKDPTSGMRAYDKDTMADYANDINNPPEPDTLAYMKLKGKKIKEVQVDMNDREFGESSFNLSHTIKYMTRMFTSIFFIQPFRKRK